MKVINLIQGTPEWHEYRKNHIGASDASVIMSVSPWKTQNQLWMEKIGLKEMEPPNQNMLRGLALEEQARHEFISRSGINVFPQVIEHSELYWMSASLDGINLEGTAIVEIKCANAQDHRRAFDGFIPDKYYPQLQHQIAVTGLEMAYYFSFDGENGVIVEVYRDQPYIDDMIEKEKEFYRCMIELEPPPLMDRDYIERYDERWLNAALEYRLTKLERIALERKELQLKDRLYSISNNTNTMGGGIKLQKVIKKGLVDYTRIPELENVNLDDYRKPKSEYWKITET